MTIIFIFRYMFTCPISYFAVFNLKWYLILGEFLGEKKVTVYMPNLNINTKSYRHLQQYHPLNLRQLIWILDVSFLSLYFDKPVKTKR